MSANRIKLYKCESKKIEDLRECMKLKGSCLINVFKINDIYIVGVYKGEISKYDILIKYRQKENERWSRIRTPKHIHWVVDVLIKMQINPEQGKNFIDFLLGIWEVIEPIMSEEARLLRTSYNYILDKYAEELSKYKELSKHGEYSIKFLLFLADLLMTQEKTNRADAYMFKRLLEALKKEESLYQIVSIATHTGR
ncbi:MAG: hypothetical protein RMJ32_02550 [Aquificaceae bacterium]|nr:hypothetical protein [Aquificaceae bacterium]